MGGMALARGCCARSLDVSESAPRATPSSRRRSACGRCLFHRRLRASRWLGVRVGCCPRCASSRRVQRSAVGARGRPDPAAVDPARHDVPADEPAVCAWTAAAPGDDLRCFISPTASAPRWACLRRGFVLIPAVGLPGHDAAAGVVNICSRSPRTHVRGPPARDGASGAAPRARLGGTTAAAELLGVAIFTGTAPSSTRLAGSAC